MRPSKIDFNFLFYTLKNTYLKKKKSAFLNAYKVKKKYRTFTFKHHYDRILSDEYHKIK